MISWSGGDARRDALERENTLLRSIVRKLAGAGVDLLDSDEWELWNRLRREDRDA